jgi:hypothetical protein
MLGEMVITIIKCLSLIKKLECTKIQNGHILSDMSEKITDFECKQNSYAKGIILFY